ncbi:Vacuolar protein sorting-associated protein 16 homolog [Serendipita indica DSM 11827]|uniref:Probable vacuolar protein sorting-associated protein 16 homolog n=1 Tax=Serendipita indica (strain DSM 11827) TaxID=1109443 RepID=G4TGC8_SERID|nr:Vacuolar protein sorting-associated protein 16 homolog [Serendipita indica DSM 11827]CCA70355.1 related to vacuolar protein sorting VACUOLELESS1 [Serendipita indica DSM 11827]
MDPTSLIQHPTLTWEAVNDGAVFYSRRHVYHMNWNLGAGGGGSDLSGYVVAAARFGGPIAIIRDNSKLIALGRTTFTKPVILVYSSAGTQLASITWELSKIVALGWTMSEELVVLNEDGQYRLYDLLGTTYRTYSLGPEAAETGVVDARIFEAGLVALTGNLSFLEVRAWSGSKPTVLSSPVLTGPPITWTIIPPDQTSSRHAEVIMAVEGTIYTCDNLEHIDQQLGGSGPFTHIAVSPNGRSLALLTSSSNLWVITSDFQRKILEFDVSSLAATSSTSTPIQLAWCGSDAVLLSYPTTVVLLAPGGETLTYHYVSTPYMVTEPDGVRVLNKEDCEFVQRVPDSLEKVFRPGSTAPAAFLFDASESFARNASSSSSVGVGVGSGSAGRARTDESIRALKPDLAFAVDACIDAAGREWDVAWQKKLLAAAKFGRAFIDLYDPRPFVAMGQTLKVLNAIRYYEIGIPMTYQQYTLLSPEELLARLTSRSMHLLALRIANFLSIKPDAVLKHWACAKISKTRPDGGIGGGIGGVSGTAEDDEDVARGIVEKFEAMGAGAGSAGVSYAEIAKRAWESGRNRLATALLDHETRAAEQVPLLLGMREDGRALEKAVDSGDTDLVYQVLLNLHKRLPLGDFFKLIEDGGPKVAPASRLLQIYARDQNREMLRDFFYSDDRRVDSGLLLLEDASTQEDLTARINSIKAAQKFFSEDRERGFEARMMDENARLLALQQTLEKDVDGKAAFVGLSVGDTIMLCLQCGLHKRAEKVRSDWKVSDKQFWWLKLRALTEAKAWDELDAFSKSKKSPIGYEPFVRHLVSKGFHQQAAAYVARCDAAKRGELYMLCNEYRAAGKEFKDRGDKAGLSELVRTCPDRLIARELQGLLSSM